MLADDYAHQNPAIWLAVARLTQHSEKAVITYRRFDGRIGSHTVDPYHLIAWRGEWYLVAYHHRRRKISSFALSRVSKVKGSGACFSAPDQGEIKNAMKDSFGIVGGDNVMHVRLRFSPAVASYIAGRMCIPRRRSAGSMTGLSSFG
ncbi:MAG: WYL domain-containing protein [Verrucomicrobia bacterium]|nr:WYL domain-containing protein [Verrucomicrobiota bacterium]